jgi:hypothetical protein
LVEAPLFGLTIGYYTIEFKYPLRNIHCLIRVAAIVIVLRVNCYIHINNRHPKTIQHSVLTVTFISLASIAFSSPKLSYSFFDN